MASDSEDADGEDLGLISPGLIRVLRNVLDEYPDDGQILKEMIQNAEDAGAQKVKILTDRRHFNRDVDNKTRRKHPHLAFLQGPSLCVYNDAEFTDRDWEGIRMLHTSVKEKDPLKVGRFGLGFKSVFHLTDRLVIISGKHILYMDPFKGEENYCKRKRIAQLKGRELESVLRCTEGVFGVTRETFQADGGHFQGTIFWFPLRQNASYLSSIVYTDDHVHDLLNSFKAESRFILLFLKNIERVQVFSRKDTQDPEEHFTVELSASCLQTVRAERQKFIRVLQEAGSELPDHGVDCITEMTIDTTDHLAPSRDSQKWLVVNYHPGQGEVSSELTELCADPELAYRPYVGVAIPLDKQREFQSQIFCFLPLPLLSRSPTGLPVHVNGYFALSQNRRHLKWPTQDQLDNQAHLEAPVRWNCLMVKELVPRAYKRLLGRLKDLHVLSPEVFYSAWPSMNDVDDMWRPLVQPLYNTLGADSSFYTQANGGQWIPLDQAVLPSFQAHFSVEVIEAVLKVYTETNQNLVRLPDHVKQGLKESGLLGDMQTVDPHQVSDLLTECISQRLDSVEKLLVFQYFCCNDDVPDLLVNKPLLPLSDGTFGVFRHRDDESSLTYWCEKHLISLFPGLESEFCDASVPAEIWQHLHRIALAGELSVRGISTSDDQIPDLITRSLKARSELEHPSLPFQDPWIQQVWKFLSETDPWCRDLSRISHLNLLPCQTGNTLTLFPLNGLYVCSAARGLRSLDPHLAASLTKLLITVLPQLPDYVTHEEILGRLVHYPNCEGIVDVLGMLTANAGVCSGAVEKFNSSASATEREALVKFLAATVDLDDALHLLQQLNLFVLISGEFASVQEVKDIIPERSLPVYPNRPLHVGSGASRFATVKLGAKQLTLTEIAREILLLMQSGNDFTNAQTLTFVNFLLDDKDLCEDQELLGIARQVRFVPTEDGRLWKPEDLYDPACPILSQLFLADNRFPNHELAMDDIRRKLTKLGLRTANDVKASDLTATALKIEHLLLEEQIELANKKAHGLFRFLCSYGKNFSADTLKEISLKQCLPCSQESEKPDNYPTSLLKSSPLIVRPMDMCNHDLIKLLGSTMPVLKQNMPMQEVQRLRVTTQPDAAVVLKHLDNVILQFRLDEISQYRSLLAEIFIFLKNHCSDHDIRESVEQKECVLVESGPRFVCPGRFWINCEDSDISLKPYRFPLPVEMMPARDLFLTCGSSEHQGEELLQVVLGEIKDSYDDEANKSTVELNRDLQLVKQILDVLKTSTTIPKGTVLLPVQDEDSVLRFKPATECTVQTGQWQPHNLSQIDDDEDIFFVHTDISVATALALGALELKERTLTGVEALDFGFGQHEELTSRLHNLLKESYTDGFSVPKELIQNADDAGATEVRFLLDERENLNARSNLISEDMASLQGPAIWAYNDAVFTDKDFENITKLGAGTKKEDASKVGRFGLGFNAVYNLTDVPSFISRHILAMFDPHVKYLQGAGLKLDFKRQVNRSLLSRMPAQFLPYQDIFGCSLQKAHDVFFDGTLFRFPLRTSDQAAQSKIKGENYSDSKRREFLRMLLERAGNLLLFTQSVTKIQVYHIDSKCSDPSEAQCLLTVSKKAYPRILRPNAVLSGTTILRYCTTNWPAVVDINIMEDVSVEMEVSDRSESVCGVKANHVVTRWKLAWATGTGESAGIAQRQENEGLVPLAAVAVQLGQNSVLPLADSPSGFYKTGHLFCFLPLPEEMVSVTMPVHVNGTFALTSSRRSLLVQTEDDLNATDFNWNEALFGDAVCRAYLLLLENLEQEAFADFTHYFNLWPRSSSAEIKLFQSFYRRMVSDRNKVFPVPHPGNWVDFQEAWILEPALRESECGQLAWSALNQFWNKEGQLVDVPSTVCKLIEEGGQLEALSGRVISTEEFFRDVFFPNIHSDTWKNEERDRLTLYALDIFLSGARLSPSQFLTSIARNAAFVSTTCGNLQQPVDLYDPSSPILIELFDGEDKFPSETFSQDNVLQTLQNLGLRSNTNVKPDDLTSVATSVEEFYISGQSALALRKAEGLWKLLVNHGVSIDAETLKQLATIQCLPCLQEKPSSLPSSLPLNCQNILERPSEMCLFEHIQLVGCVMPVVRKDMPPSVASALGVASRPAPGQVLNHLKTAVQALNLNSTDDVDRYRRMETKIFKELEIHSPEVDVVHALQQERCVLVESGDSFVCPSKFWIERRSADIQVLSPYKYQLPRRLKQAEKLFRVLGASQYQDEIVLQKVLEEIRDSHENQIPSQEIFDRDLQLVKQILDVLRCSQSVPKGTVLLPVEHSEGSVLKFKPASECTIGCWSESMVTMAAAEGEEEIILVFQEIHSGTAQALGALQMRDRALTGVEGLDFDYEQREELTTRLHNLLNDSYTDGFSVPKELIQNADDAGAEEVRFLLDERENLDDRSNLISDDLASLQGPAIWAYNDAVFTDEDFENIIKLGAGTKKEDASKVGRFGLGFNAVYNLTDVPSFISRHTMAIFDPHKKYLRGGAGLKMDFRRQVNRSLLSRMPQQFQPFQGVFDCRLKNEGDVMYEGTLFRFPLRTPEQAAQSKLKGESYSQDKRREFLRLLLHRAGSLLMFTQNVRKVQVFYLSADCTDPSNAECLLTVNKTSRLQILQPLAGALNTTILQFCTEHWPGITDLQILEQVTIEKEVKEAADSVCKVKADYVTTHWRLAWATGTGASAEAAQRYRQKGLVPLAGVAVQFKENNIIMPSESPSGFYTSGHLFCFLPLPEEMVHMKLQVHINGTFALASSRQRLLVKTEDDIRSSVHDWNSVLFGDAVCRAYLLLLENLTLDVRPPYDCYFDLLPDSGEASLDQNFYKRLVQDGNRVFPVPGQENWVAFSDAWFLDPVFRDSECGQLAWDAVKLFWDRDGHLVDVPTMICRLICGRGQAEAFQNRVITKKAFFTSFLFPNIDSKMWVSTNRDRLVLLALKQDDREIQELVANHYCIPCRDSVELRRPCDLIHPEGAASKLYSPQDHRFPQGGSRQAHDDSGVDFSSHEILSRLEKLGMIKDDLPWEMVIERARSVHSLMTDDRGSAIYRAVSLIDYLSSVKDFAFRFNCCPSEVKEDLSVIRFLPVLHKPDHWPFPWGAQEDDVLAAPNELFSDTMKFLVGCNAKLLDLKAMEQHRSVNMWKTVLESLGVRMQNKPQDETLLEKSIDQLLTVAECVQENESIDKQSVQNICSGVYSYLSNSLRSSEDDDVRNCIAEHLCGRNVVWTGTMFVPSTRAAFRLGYDCQPYLFKVEPRQSYRPFLELVGVKETFDSKDVLWVLRKIHEEHEGQQLSRPVINTVSRAAQLLREVAEAGMQELGEREVFLPDRHGHMMPTSHLCLDDCPWLQETETMKFVHDAIPPETARALGVETKRGKDFDELMLPMEFGQSEKLTVRIKRLLEGYTFDSSLFKELLQNADDAGATEIKFIIDRRRLGKERVPEGWSEHLQGPALCVYNNKSFTTKDMQGIQNLGQGSKGDDLLKTGKYGVGFNAVYHITDVPSFWTRENDENEVICVLDPNCQYVRNSSYSKPGVKLGNVERVRQAYPDMFAGYLGQCLDTSKPGTMFRFPLRSHEMAKTSEIKNQLVTSEDITELLEHFRPEMSSCLLFLNNLQKIGIYSVNSDGKIKVGYEVEKHVHEKSSGQLKDLKSSLQQASLSISNRTVGLRDIPEYEAVLHMKFTDSQGKEEEWLTVNRVGFTDTNSLSEQLLNEWQLDHFRLLPRGGVAVRLAQKKVGRGTQTSSEEYHAFCILPLPVVTRLPMHVNGYFALDHETRRNLWDNDGDARTEWNTATALQLIVPAYITAVQQLKTELFPEGETLCNSSIALRLRHYHAMFPDPEAAPSDFWKRMIHEFYRQTARKELAIFPVSNTASQLFEWMPAYKGYGFPGYFSDLVNFFRKQREAQQERLVVLSQGGQSGPCHHGQGQESDRNQAKRLQALLKDLNMKVLDTPFHVYSYFKQSGVSGVQEVTPDSVLHFLKSAQSGHHDACTVRDLPRHVSNTPFKSSDNVRFLVEYVQNCSNFLHQLGGLPLCLRQSDNLYFFETCQAVDRPVVSGFFDLLHKTPNAFVHGELYKYFEPVTPETQYMIKELDINTFEQLLPQTLPETHYKTGRRCSVNTGFMLWVARLWEFLQNRLGRSGRMSIEERRQHIENALQCLSDWSLIPVKSVSRQELLLYPVKGMHQVVYLTRTRDQSHSKMWEILRQLPLAFLSTESLHIPTIATDIVSSLSHPVALLRALTFCRTGLEAVAQYGHHVLSYFSDSLPVLQDCFSQNDLHTLLTDLPFYTVIDGSITFVRRSVRTICLDVNIPPEGLMTWSQTRPQPLQLLRLECIPGELCRFLGFMQPSLAEFCKMLLSSLSALPDNDVLTHMYHLKISINDIRAADENIVHLLKETPFILVRGQRYRARDFYRQQEPVFEAMLPPYRFPPTPFCTRDWESFMKLAGIVYNVTDDMFVEFARQLQAEDGEGLSAAIIRKSQTLVRHLFKKNNSNLPERVKEIRFVRPSEWASTSTGRLLSATVKPFSEHKLVSFAESCREEHLHLVWSSSSILHPTADPSASGYPADRLGFQVTPPPEKVTPHVKSLCLALAGDGGREKFSAFDMSRDLLLKVFENVYQHLCASFSEDDLRELREHPVICDLSNNLMLKPECVVIDLRPEEEIKGHIQKADFKFGKFFDSLFKKLGVVQRVTANHYALVLSRLKLAAGDQALHVEEMKVVSKAVEGLFRCLALQDPDQAYLAVRCIFLPSESKQLLKSNELVFIDNKHLHRRLRELPEDLNLFIGFDKLKVPAQVPWEKIQLLPVDHEMVWLSRIVKEVIPEEVKDRSTEGIYSRTLQAEFTQPEFVQAVIRLVYDHHSKNSTMDSSPFTQEDANRVKESLFHISVREVAGLQTVLEWRGMPVEGSEGPKPSYVKKCNTDPRSCVVYVCGSTSDGRGIKDTVLRSLKYAVEFVLNMTFTDHLQSALKDAAEAMASMDEMGVAQCDFWNLGDGNDLVFPPAGTFVPISEHCYLDNNFYEFYNGEHVGFEVYDPSLEPRETEEGDAVYIYAIVKKEVKQGDEVIPLLARRYLIDLGPDRGTAEVSVTKLYKFVRKARRGTSRASVPYEGDASNIPEDSRPLDLKEVLREIRGLLKEAWQLPKERDRMRVVKRLMLKDPDKNQGNEEFCTRVCQMIQYYFSLLKSGRTLPDDEDDVGGPSNSSSGPSSDPSFHAYSTFFEHMLRRGRAYRRSYESSFSSAARHGGHYSSGGSSNRSYSGYSSGHHFSYGASAANPQPGEGRRWLRQAQADMSAAKGSCAGAHNWVCYQCHQAVEKALKAVLYSRDAGGYLLQSHDLNSLAQLVGDPNISQLARSLEDRVGNHMRMRYPDVLTYPRIPDDVFGIDDATFACDVTARLLARVQSLLTVGVGLSKRKSVVHRETTLLWDGADFAVYSSKFQ